MSKENKKKKFGADKYLNEGVMTPFVKKREAQEALFVGKEKTINFGELNEEGALSALKEDPLSFKFLDKKLKENEEFVKKAVLLDTRNVMFVPNTFKENKDFIKFVVHHNPKGFTTPFREAHPKLRNDPEVVMLAVTSSPHSLEYAHPRLQNDRKIVLKATEGDGNVFQYCGKKLQCDQNLVKQIIDQSEEAAYAIQHASRKIRGDKEIVMKAVSKKGIVVYCVSDELRDDEEVIREALKTYPDAKKYASERVLETMKE